jgi:orotate phosphoribosyltransferase
MTKRNSRPKSWANSFSKSLVTLSKLKFTGPWITYIEDYRAGINSPYFFHNGHLVNKTNYDKHIKEELIKAIKDLK